MMKLYYNRIVKVQRYPLEALYFHLATDNLQPEPSTLSMIPIYLTISGFLSYRDPVEIDFTTFDLACIAGRNGAGKSSILDAITWALFGQARRRDDAIINAQSETAEVSLTFEYEKNIYRVTRSNPRGKTARLEFQIASNFTPLARENSLPTLPQPTSPNTHQWKNLSEHTLRTTQTRIDEILRLDYDTFINAAFFLQGKADQFTQQRPGDRKRILASILGLEVWEIYRGRAFERRKTIEDEIVGIDGRLAEINAELAEEETRKNRLAELEIDLEHLTQTRLTQETTLENIKKITATLEEQRKLVDTLSQQLDSIQKRETGLCQRLTTRLQEKETHTEILSRAVEIEAAYQSWVEARESLAYWDAIAGQFREHERKREEPRLVIESERGRLTQEIETLKEMQFRIANLQASLPELQTSITRQESIISQLNSEIDKRKTIENELVSAQEILANAKAENPRLKAEMDELKSRIDRLSETDGAACPLCGQPLSSEERQNLVEELNTIGKTMGDKYRANRILLAEADDKVNLFKQEINGLAHLNDDLLQEKDALNKTNAQLEQIQTQVITWENEEAPRLNKLNQILTKESYALEARAALAEIDAELKGIGYDALQHDTVRRSEREGRTAAENFHALERAKAALDPLENEIVNLHGQISGIRADIQTQQATYDEAAASLAAAESQAPDIHQAQRDFLDIQEQENRVRLEVGAAQQKVLVLDDLKARRKTFEAEREILALKIGQYKQLERAFSKDGIPALLIEGALPQIEIKANEILERLSGGNMSVQFITQREYKDTRREDLKETLDIQISDNAGVRDYEMFSGGEAFRVNFAIRLALSEVLAQRAGARLQTLVIDEGFGSQDEIGQQRLIEAINTVKSDFAKILVITHIEAMKDAFPTRIQVEKTPRGSTVSIL
jgi:exonuclease SbcC